VILSDDKATLHALRERLREQLIQEHLRLHPPKAELFQTREGIDLLGPARTSGVSRPDSQQREQVDAPAKQGRVMSDDSVEARPHPA